MDTKTKVVIGAAVAAAVAGAIFWAKAAESPIEIADGSVKLTFNDKFNKEGLNKIRASKLLREPRYVKVVAADNSTVETIRVKNRDWTLAPYTGGMTIGQEEFLLVTDVVVGVPQGTELTPLDQAGMQFLFNPGGGSSLLPAKLVFNDGKDATCANYDSGAKTCTLCPGGGCKLFILYRKFSDSPD